MAGSRGPCMASRPEWQAGCNWLVHVDCGALTGDVLVLTKCIFCNKTPPQYYVHATGNCKDFLNHSATKSITNLKICIYFLPTEMYAFTKEKVPC